MNRIQEININTSEVERILIKLKKLEANKFYLKTDCTLVSTAKKINTNTSYLSKIINFYFDKSFNSYKNTLRINYSINRLKKDKFFRYYSIQSLANEVGIKSKESFNKAFKEQTGVLPSVYIKELKKRDNS